MSGGTQGGAGPPSRQGAGPLAPALTLLAAAALCLLAAACTTQPPASRPSSPAAPRTSSPSPPVPGATQPAQPAPALRAITWMMTRAALASVMADPVLRERLSGSRIYEILQPGQQLLRGVAAEPVLAFPSRSALAAAVHRDQIPAGTYGLLYDPEAWALTPAAEQRAPVAAATEAARITRARGLRFIVAPALNLTTILAPGSSRPRWQRFLDLNLVASLAQIADAIDLQAQSLERDTATYQAFVRQAAGQARSANPRVTLLAGLSSNPPGAPVTSQHLLDAVTATSAAVDGYWLNIPGAGPRCPTCNARQPAVAMQMLQGLRE